MVVNTPATGDIAAMAHEAHETPARYMADLAQALIVAASPINRIVLSRIAERACLKTSAHEPAKALGALTVPDKSPGLVIVDIDAGTSGREDLFAHLSERRSASPAKLPLVIAVVGALEAASLPGLIFDATVVRPVTPETLQPVIERLIADAKA
ncbi:response regulator [Nitratireductor sp. ZSWI3]|uniref:response regulator n=1 Tax=Nitratireductor sp. ZSWI3 TaxID=2966359 RepID=UPI00214FC2BB|nr:response regulator [Nitratireductor sp. ZSWI3]MCR4268222.1 response regulator [Nitratireductor sp. ZSWI3]